MSGIIISRVLDNWPGTPEELGADLAIASRKPELADIFAPLRVKAFVRRWNSERHEARARILSVEGGVELLEYEEKENDRKSLIVK